MVKPLPFIAQGKKYWSQPAVKVRGREYLRIIYGPEYTAHLDALRRRGLGRKRSLVSREFALGWVCFSWSRSGLNLPLGRPRCV